MPQESRESDSNPTPFAYIADGWTTQGERLDASVFVIEADGRLRPADANERATFYRRYGANLQ